jgi:DNA-directed RNA polymerase specialized sigma24 family protein
VRRESLRLLQTHVREIPTDDPMPSGEHQTDGPEVRLLEHERYAVLTRALATLLDRQRRLMTLIALPARLPEVQIVSRRPIELRLRHTTSQ